MRLTIGTKIGGGFSLALVILLVLGVVSYFSATNLIKSTERVAFTYRVQGELDAVMQALTDAETAQRGYVITDRKSFLESFAGGTSDIDRHIGELRTLLSGNPSQLTQLQALEALITAKTEWNRRTIALQDTVGFSASQEKIAAETGRGMMDSVRAAIVGMKSVEDQLMKVRDAAAASNAACDCFDYCIRNPGSAGVARDHGPAHHAKHFEANRSHDRCCASDRRRGRNGRAPVGATQR